MKSSHYYTDFGGVFVGFFAAFAGRAVIEQRAFRSVEKCLSGFSIG